MKATNNKIIDRFKLIEVYKQFKRDPKRVFIAGDFNPSTPHLFRMKYLNTLISLSLIEQVPVTYKYGSKYIARKEIKGYKLKSFFYRRVL